MLAGGNNHTEIRGPICSQDGVTEANDPSTIPRARKSQNADKAQEPPALKGLDIKQLSTVTPRYRSNHSEPSASPSLPPQGFLGGPSD